jgi:hypothetical protein
MAKHVETILSWFYFCGFGMLCGVVGYLLRRNAAKFGRQSAEAMTGTPRMLRWLYYPECTEAEFVWRYRSAGLAQMIMGCVFLVAGIVMIVVTTIRIFAP